MIGTALLLATSAVQASQRSGTQLADQLVGETAGVAQVAGYSLLGEKRSIASEDAEVVAAVRTAGGSEARLGWLAPGIRLSPEDRTRATVEEDDWASSPFPGRLALISGRWATRPNEADVSPGLAQKYPVGSHISFADGLFDQTVVGVAADRFSRSQSLVLLGSGGWAAAQQRAPKAAQVLEIYAQRTLYFNGSTAARVQKAVDSVVSGQSNQQAVIFTREDLISARHANIVEYTLLSMAGPLIAGFLAGMILMRALARVRRILWTIGVPFRSSRIPLIVTGAMVAVLGSTIGGLLGIALTPALLIFFDRVADVEPGPIQGLAATVLLSLAGDAVGFVAALITFKNRPAKAIRVRAFRLKPQQRFAIAAIASVAFAALGLFSTQGSRDPNGLLLGATCFGVAVILPAPHLLRRVVALSTQSVRWNLTARRLREDRSIGIVLVSASLLLLTALSSITFINSAVVATSASNRSTVLPAQISLGSTGISKDQQEQLAASLQESLGLGQPMYVRSATNSVADLYGPVLVANSITDVGRFFHARLSAQEQAALSAGQILRPASDGVNSREFKTSGGTVSLPVTRFKEAGQASEAWGGVLLSKTTQTRGIEVSRPDAIWLNVTPAQLRRAPSVAQHIGIRPSLLGVYRPADQISLPLSAVIIAVGTIIINALILAATTAADARRLRPTLSGLYALGAGVRWLRSVVVIRAAAASGLVVFLAVVGAGIGAGLGLFFSGLPFSLALPWPLLFTTVIGVLVSSALVALFVSRRVSPTEWRT